MTQWTRTIDRQITNAIALPAWRTAMTVPFKLYEIGAANRTLESAIVWPHGGYEPPGLWGENEINTIDCAGWTSGVHCEDASAFGKIVTQSAGEFSIPTNEQAFDLGTGLWEMWSQPVYYMTQATAAAANADCYYNPTEAATFPANRNYATGPWDGGFPMTYGGWIWFRKVIYMSLGNNSAYLNRYNSSLWLPPSMTGLGAGARVVNEDSLCGPGGGGRLGSTDSGWYDASRLWPSGANKFYLRYTNSVTKARGRFPVPEPESANGGDITRNMSFTDVANKRLYMFTKNTAWKIFYYDMSSGIAGATPSSVTTVTLNGGGAFVDTGNGRSSRVFTEGHPNGRRLLYFVDEGLANSLAMVDVDTSTMYRLTIPGLNMHGSGTVDATRMGMGYVPASNQIVISSRLSTGTPKCHQITIPSDPTVAANYVCTNTTLDASGVTLETTLAPWLYGWGTLLGKGLNCFFIKQYREKILAYTVS